MEKIFESWMIVYINSELRVKTFNNFNKKITTNLFPAIDCMNHYTKYKKLALDNNYCTKDYIETTKSNPGKLGCNLSHQILLKKILEESKTMWNLVLEDDVEIDENFITNVLSKIECADKNNHLFIQLYTHPRFFETQQKKKQINKDLFEMTFQWGTPAYLIHKNAIPLIFEKYPLNENIDISYGKMISSWKSLCWLNNGIRTLGSIDNFDNNSAMGSIIYNKKPKN